MNNLDDELVLTFLSKYRSLEQALVRAGFARTGRRPGSPQPDWERFARHIEGKFDPQASPELMGAVCTLLADLEKQAFHWERLQGTIPGERPGPRSDIVWLSKLIPEIGNRLLNRINFMGEAGCDDVDVLAALLIIQVWAHLDPGVASLLAQGQ